MNQNIEQRLDTFFTKYKHQIFKKGEILIRADDDPSGVFYLKGGIVKEYAISSKGENVILNLFKPVSFFPMNWAINDSPNKYFFEAVTQVEAWKAPRDNVIEFIRKENDILLDLISRVYNGTEGLLMRMVYLMSGTAYTRLITEILICTKRFGIQDKNNGIISCEITEKDLAALTGMTVETISREIKILRQRGLIRFGKGKLIVLNISNLEKELSNEF